MEALPLAGYEPRGHEPPGPEPSGHEADGRRAFAVLLGEFRRAAVLVPYADPAVPDAGWWTAELGGVRWICAFSDEAALARFAAARGEADRPWTYRRVLGARLLDVAVPASVAPCGVALDAADGPGGLLFPPLPGVVPDGCAVGAAHPAGHRPAGEALPGAGALPPGAPAAAPAGPAAAPSARSAGRHRRRG
jgi:hypothetical protein